jgi:hypothetical protein
MLPFHVKSQENQVPRVHRGKINLDPWGIGDINQLQKSERHVTQYTKKLPVRAEQRCKPDPAPQRARLSGSVQAP